MWLTDQILSLVPGCVLGRRRFLRVCPLEMPLRTLTESASGCLKPGWNYNVTGTLLVFTAAKYAISLRQWGMEEEGGMFYDLFICFQ